MATQVQSGLATGTEGLVCFVCDVGVVGRYYTLATCRTQTTKVRLIEKLGQLVGDDYMVIISEEDVICRGCATMINSLDRLEKEVGSLRSIVLRYLEKKYDMEDGELVNARSNPAPPAPPPPPPPKQSVKDSTIKSDLPATFHARKRKFMEEATEDLKETLTKGKGGTWLQCNRCKYTTPGPLPPPEDKAPKTNNTPKQLPIIVEQVPVNNSDKVNGEELTIETPKQILQSITTTLDAKKDSTENAVPPQTVDIITSQMAEDQFVDTTTVNTVNTVNSDGTTGIEIVPAARQVTLQAVEAEDGTNTICMVDENGIIVQKVEQAEDGTLYVQMADGSDATKQVLSVAEDGSVQMVEVLWDDMVTTDDGTTMVTF